LKANKQYRAAPAGTLALCAKPKRAAAAREAQASRAMTTSHPPYQPQDEQQYNGADGGAGDDADDADTELNSQSRQQPATRERADDADHDISKDTEAAALDDHAGQPARNRTD